LDKVILYFWRYACVSEVEETDIGYSIFELFKKLIFGSFIFGEAVIDNRDTVKGLIIGFR